MPRVSRVGFGLFLILVLGMLAACERADSDDDFPMIEVPTQTIAQALTAVAPTHSPIQISTESESESHLLLTATPTPGQPITVTPYLPSDESTEAAADTLVCLLPDEEWLMYRVQPGDTLSAIALRTNSTTAELAMRNCLTDVGQLAIGQELYVPNEPTTPTPTVPAGSGNWGSSDSSHITYQSSDCYLDPFAPFNLYFAGGTFELTPVGLPALPLYKDHDSNASVGSVAEGTLITLLDGPYCYALHSDPADGWRRWWVETADGRQGWIEEYVRLHDGIGYHLWPTQPHPELFEFVISPNPATIYDTITIRWDIRYADELSIFNGANIYTMPPKGELSIEATQAEIWDNQINFSFYAPDPYGNQPLNHEVMIPIVTEPAVRIESFSVSPSNSPSNGVVELSWVISGDGDGHISWAPYGWTLQTVKGDIRPGSGTVEVQLPDRPHDLWFTLYVQDEYGLSDSVSINLEVSCPYLYFIADPAIQNETCPKGNPQELGGVYQDFEHGFMVWELIGGQPYITVLLNDGRVLGRFSDSWNGESDNLPDLGEPPSNLLYPERGFGNLWGINSEVRDSLGWAIAPEVEYVQKRQAVDKTHPKYGINEGEVYLTIPSGQIVRYAPTIDLAWVYISD